MIEQLRYDILNGVWSMMPDYFYSNVPLFFSLLNGENSTMSIDLEQAQKAHNPYSIELSSELFSRLFTSSEGEQNEEVKKVMIIPVQGTITKYNLYYYGGFGTKTLARFIREAYADPEVVGVVLDMDSGGGVSTASEILCSVIRENVKPVVTFVNGVCGSAAYRIAASTKEIIISQDSDILGSIGTMFPFVDDTEYYKKLGVKFEDIYSDLSPLKNSWYRRLREGGEGSKSAVLEELINPLAQNIIDSVKSDRGSKINSKYEDRIFKGATFMGDETITSGLADKKGNMQLAIERVVELSKDYNNKNSNTMSKGKFSILSSFFSKNVSEEDEEKVLGNLEDALKERDEFKEQLEAKNAKVDELTAQLKTKSDEVTASNKKVGDLEAEVTSLKAEKANLKAKLDADPETVSVVESVEKGEEDVTAKSQEKPVWEQTEWAAEAAAAKAAAKNSKVEL
ncbi:S49 family peptidase [Flexithrix dorotheae]|uniref:S49 family peptidase n=1 Tax=Flexithrix dorotheae TaxID=70993 RepID=UPI0003A76568|nr:S49 family peptidase [Flexithrix dorotheae]